MNAYELADELLRDNTQLTVTSAYMLRQQADRIAELEKFNKAILKKGGYPYEKSNPIAWMSPDGKVSTTEGILFHIPLYTTPQTKPLSDEEIHELIVNKVTDYELCRAIEERHGIK